MGLLEEVLAQRELANAGSVMAKPQLPQWRQQLPQTLGPTAGTAAQAGLSLLDALLSFGPNPLDAAGGGGGQVDNLAGIFRTIGLKRAGGDLNPAEYIAELMAQPKYERYRELVQGMVRRGLGDEFPVFRGKAQVDPLIKALTGASKELPGTTAVSLDPNIAEYFARVGAEQTRKPAYIMKGRATPESVQALVPRRNTHGHEQELLLDPAQLLKNELAAKAMDMGYGSVEFVKPNAGGPIDDIIKELTSGELIRSMSPVKSGVY